MDRRVTLQSRVIPLAALRSDGSLYHSTIPTIERAIIPERAIYIFIYLAI